MRNIPKCFSNPFYYTIFIKKLIETVCRYEKVHQKTFAKPTSKTSENFANSYRMTRTYIYTHPHTVANI